MQAMRLIAKRLTYGLNFVQTDGKNKEHAYKASSHGEIGVQLLTWCAALPTSWVKGPGIAPPRELLEDDVVQPRVQHVYGLKHLRHRCIPNMSDVTYASSVQPCLCADSQRMQMRHAFAGTTLPAHVEKPQISLQMWWQHEQIFGVIFQ